MSVYFIQYGESGPIKIGYSNNPFERIKVLQSNAVAHQLKLLAIMDGSRFEESAMHLRFREFHLTRELFSPGLQLMEFIVSLGIPSRNFAGWRPVSRLNAKDKTLKIRLSAELDNQLIIAARAAGVTVSDIIRVAYKTRFHVGSSPSILRVAVQNLYV